MQRPPWLLPQPDARRTPEMIDEFDGMFDDIQQRSSGTRIEYPGRFPKWQFLSYVAQVHGVVLHGSYEPCIAEVEPRQADDVRAYSAQRAIYATTDGIWAIFFAILDRRGHPMSLANTCLRIRDESGELSEPFYYFSITQSALDAEPWCEGAVYILSREGFSQESPRRLGPVDVEFPHWIGRQAATPLAYLPVGPGDFPFLEEIRGHDDAELRRRYEEDPGGFPWEES